MSGTRSEQLAPTYGDHSGDQSGAVVRVNVLPGGGPVYWCRRPTGHRWPSSDGSVRKPCHPPHGRASAAEQRWGGYLRVTRVLLLFSCRPFRNPRRVHRFQCRIRIGIDGQVADEIPPGLRLGVGLSVTSGAREVVARRASLHLIGCSKCAGPDGINRPVASCLLFRRGRPDYR